MRCWKDGWFAFGSVRFVVVLFVGFMALRCSVQASVLQVGLDPRQPWTETALEVPSGAWMLVVDAAGTFRQCPGCPENDAGGSQGGMGPNSSNDPRFLVPGLYDYSLIGRVGSSGVPFQLRSSIKVVVEGPGELEFGFNDCCDFTDNSGSYSITAILTPQAFTHSVDPKNPWNDVGISIPAGTFRLELAASGLVQACGDCPRAKPDGTQVGVGGPNPADEQFLVPGLSSLSLVGRIGEAGVPIQLGEAGRFTVRGPGKIQLGFNDCCNFSDNSGRFAVVATLIPVESDLGRIDSIELYPGILVVGTAGEGFRIEASLDPADDSGWRPIGFLRLAGTSAMFLDRSSPREARRFYRAVRW